jgi:putative FmdB family regulatory protein
MVNDKKRSFHSMPTYEYQCEKCGMIFEEYQSISAAPLTKCKKAECGGTVKKLFSPGAGFLFKGSGFYITDYRSDSYKKQAKAESASSGSSVTESKSSTPSPSSSSAPSTSSTK